VIGVRTEGLLGYAAMKAEISSQKRSQFQSDNSNRSSMPPQSAVSILEPPGSVAPPDDANGSDDSSEAALPPV